MLFFLLALAVSGCGTTTAAAPASASKSYSALVLADAPAAYWRMDEPTGTTMVDATKNRNNGHYDGIVMLGQPGPLAADGSTAVGFDGATGAGSVPSSTSLQVKWITTTAVGCSSASRGTLIPYSSPKRPLP